MNARLPEKKIDSIRIDTGAKRIEVTTTVNISR